MRTLQVAKYKAQIKKAFLFLLIPTLLFNCTSNQSLDLVSDIEEFNSAVEKAKPGDKIILKNGVWNNSELVFYGEGTEEKPILLSVESKGRVSLEGQSNLHISGKHLQVEGLVFKNGYTPTGSVISFRTDKNTPCNNC